MVSMKIPDSDRNYVLIEKGASSQGLLDLEVGTLIDLYKLHGAILFRGFSLNQDIFAEMSARFCTHSMTNGLKNRLMINRAANIQTADRGRRPFALHPEMSGAPWKPDACFFGCINAPSVDGETLICDGIEIVEKLPANIVKAFSDRQLLYEFKIQKRYLKYWFNSENPTIEQLLNPPNDCSLEFLVRDDTIYARYFTDVIHKPMFSEKRAWGNFLLFSRFTLGRKNLPTFEDGTEVPGNLMHFVKIVSEKLQRVINWQANDLLMLDNTRFLHGRRNIVNANERLILSYFGFINFAKYSNHYPADDPWRDANRWKLGSE